MFRLIAIKTGKRLTKEEELFFDPSSFNLKQHYNYIKNLRPETNFLLFSCFNLKKDNTLLEYIPEKDLTGLYKLKINSKVNLEVSAIAGKNGSGKSSLIEIIYLAVHNLAVTKSVLLDGNKKRVDFPQNYLRCELIFQTSPEEFIRLKMNYDDQNQNCLVFRSTKIDENKYEFERISIEDFDLKGFFYSVAVNYSIYGLNDYRIGEWINHLFHKNDSYQTPVVINPMRRHGNFDINREEYLARTRLISNSVLKYKKTQEDVEITNGKRLDDVFFKVDKEKTKFLEQFKDEKGEDRKRTIEELIIASNVGSLKEIVDKLIKALCGNTINYENVPHKKYVELYIVKKLYRIGFTYRKYWYYMNNPGVANEEPIALKAIFNRVQFDYFLEALGEDDTHITTKLRQAVNYLRYNPLKNDEDGSWTEFSIKRNQAETFKIKFNDFAKRLIKLDDNVINCIPPSIFKFWLNINDENEGISELEKMSSGELQLIYSIQSCLYHLNNLDSYKDSTNTDKIKYKNALLIFDEVELYFHPEFQRRLIKFLLDEIDQLDLGLVINIHALFVTHSPFIVTDIPQNNLMKIENGEPKEFDSSTFAANIHELLKDTFYLEANTGQYSIEVINEIIKDLNHVLSLKGKRGKREDRDKKISKLLLSDAHKIISTIGDVVVRRKLLTMYHECTKNEKIAKSRMIQEEISRLQNSLKNLKS